MRGVLELRRVIRRSGSRSPPGRPSSARRSRRAWSSSSSLWVDANDETPESRRGCPVSPSRPSLSTRPNSRQNVWYFSASVACMSLIVERTFFTRRRRIIWICRSCCRISRDTFSERSCASTTPLTKRRYSGISASQSSMMNTRLTYSCTPRLCSRWNRSNGALRRDEQQCLVFEGALGLDRDDLERVVPGVADVAVELLVLLVGDLAARARPQRLARVEGLGLDDRLGLGGRVGIVFSFGFVWCARRPSASATR